MSSISCIITDDEPFARQGLHGYIQKIDFLDLKAECEDALELGMLLSQQPVDLVFLDIQMPNLSGVEFLKSISNPPKIIFTTAFKEYATDGFDLDVLDYLLKPISFERFLKAVYKAKDYFDLRRNDKEPEYVFVKAEGKLEKVMFDELLYVEGMENYLVIQTLHKRIITHSTLKGFYDKLPRSIFLQIHKSYIVALNKVTAIEGNLLSIGKYQVPVSRQLKDQVMNIIIHRLHRHI